MDGLSTIGTIFKMGAQSSSLTEVPDLQDLSLIHISEPTRPY